MKTESKRGLCRFELRLLGYDNSYYIERIAALEALLARKPRRIQIDLVGEGEVLPDTALLIRSILNQRSPRTQIITHARSSLCGGSVLVWLLGDVRMIRDDARLFLRRLDTSEISEVKVDEPWKDPESLDEDSVPEADGAEGEYAQLLKAINEYLPVNEVVGRLIGVPVLKQLGLVNCEGLDRFLDTTLGRSGNSPGNPARQSKEKPPQDASPITLPESHQN
jgi:hypothetical protein